MDWRRSREQTIKEVVRRLAEGSAPPESAKHLEKLLEELAGHTDLESLPEISLFIRQYLEADRQEAGRPSPFALKERVGRSLPKPWAGYTITSRSLVVLGSALALLVVVVALVSLLSKPDQAQVVSGSGREPTLAALETGEVVAEAEIQTQPPQGEGASSQETAAEAPSQGTEIAQAPPTPSLEEYTILTCVTWRDDPEAGLPGSRITWQIDSAEGREGEITVSNPDGCAEFPVSALPNTQIRLTARLPEDQVNLQIVGQAESVNDQPLTWEVLEEGDALWLTTSLRDGISTVVPARFLVVVQHTFSGRVLAEDGTGIPAATVLIWGKASPEDDWGSVRGTGQTEPDGTFVLTDTSGMPEMFYRVAVSNTVENRYMYSTSSASGPGDLWVAGEDLDTSSMGLLESKVSLGPDQLNVTSIVFNQKLDYVLLDVSDAKLQPEGLDWGTVAPSSAGDEITSRQIAVDLANVDSLQALWEDIRLPPGTYAVEIWTPDKTNARVSYQVWSEGRILEERVSYQSTRQDKGQTNQWVDFSITLNPSLVVELATSELVTVVAKPSLSQANREYNLGGNIQFGVGPVRFVKQR